MSERSDKRKSVRAERKSVRAERKSVIEAFHQGHHHCPRCGKCQRDVFMCAKCEWIMGGDR